MSALGLGAAKPGLRPSPLQRLRPSARLTRAPRAARLQCTAHGEHSHSHEHKHSHEHNQSCCGSHDHSEHSDEPHTHSHGCGHGHGGPDAANPAHRLLQAVFDATRLTQLASWLEHSVAASVGKIVLFLVAAAAAGWAGSGWAPSAAAAAAARGASLAATVGVYLLAGLPAAVDLSYDLTAGRVDTHVLMNLAVLGTLATGHALEGALLLVLFQTSHVVEHLLTDKAQGNLTALYDTIPKAAVLVEVGPDGSPDLGTARRVLAADVAVGDCMLVKPGEQVPLDGTVLHGRAMVSSEHITGESLPVLRRVGDELAAGSLNRDGVLVLRALRLAEDSTPARIARLTLDAQAQRPQLRTWLDDFGEVYSKAVVAASLGLLAALLLSGVPLLGAAGQRGAFYRAMGLLTVASPCALVMVPLAYVSAIAAIASRGILVKGGRVLDALATCSSVALDKTGTLTTGSLACTSMRPLPPSSRAGAAAGNGSSAASVLGLPAAEATAAQRAALSAAVALSLRSSHPVSDAVVLLGQQRGVDGSQDDVSDFQLVAGGGVEGVVTGSSSSGGSSSRRRGSRQPQRATFGSLEFVSGRLTAGEVAAVEKLAAEQGASSVLSVLVLEPTADASSSSDEDGSGGSSLRSVWVLSFEDSVRQQSAAAVRQLQTGSWTGASSQANRLAVSMLTGDNEASAQRVARKLGISNVKAALSPEQKLQHVQEMSGRSQQPADDAGSQEQQHGEKHKAMQRRSSSGSSSSGSSSSGSSSRRRGVRQQRRGGGGGGVIMVGDGINDAPALAAADVGVAIAANATAAASLAADVIVVNSSGIAALPLVLRIARATQAIIRQNLVLAVGSILALALPTVLGWVPLWFAVMLHEGSTLLVAINSLRLLRFGAPLRLLAAPLEEQPELDAAAAGGPRGGQLVGAPAAAA